MTETFLGAAFSSTTDLWETPQAVFKKYDRKFQFTLDPCATAENAKCKRFYTVVDDGLTKPWRGAVWFNPPYGRTIGHWMKKAFDSYKKGARLYVWCPPVQTPSGGMTTLPKDTSRFFAAV